MKMLLSLVLCALSTTAMAQATPVGLWKTVDDVTNTAKSYVRISESGGVVTGKIEKLLDQSKQAAKCDKCSDERKDQPIVGLVILRNLKRDSDDAGLWDGGDVLDPESGKVYKARLQPVDGGKKLEMRGYVGFFYRTQTWIRVE